MKERLEFSKKIKSNKGSITSFTLLSMLFFIIVLIAIYSTVSTKVQKQEKELKAIKDNYKQENIDDIYENTLNGKAGLLATYVKVGDYVSYEPDALNESALNTLKTNLSTYSGKSDSTINSAIKRDDLKWRVLDVNKKTGEVRLISAEPTNSKIELSGYNGYNNAVKLIDDACSTLYNNSKFASKVQNLKIEDIQDKMIEKDYSKINSSYGKRFTPSNKYYPSIFKNEKEQKVTVVENTTTGSELDLSEQSSFVKQAEKTQADTLDVKNTYYWNKSMISEDFYSSKYYELFINNGSNNLTYWMSSRCVFADFGLAHFDVRLVYSGGVFSYGLCASYDTELPQVQAFRPIITLNSKVRIDTANSGNGSTADSGYAIK